MKRTFVKYFNCLGVPIEGKSLMMLLILLFVAQLGISQERESSGQLTDSESGIPLFGVNVIVKGTSIGVATDFEGEYSISVSQPDVTLEFSFIGYKPMEVNAGPKTTVDVK